MSSSPRAAKAFVRGELLDGDTLLAEANGLMVRLLPGQP
jgi:hypothetical protein